jgi:hypothetical protein
MSGYAYHADTSGMMTKCPKCGSLTRDEISQRINALEEEFFYITQSTKEAKRIAEMLKRELEVK